MKKKISTIILFLLAIALHLPAQSGSSLLHLNQSFYVSGEVIWYKLYLPVDFPAGAKVITVSLYDQSGQLIDRSYLQRQGDQAISGFYKIPYEWSSDIYQLTLSATEEETNMPLILAATQIPIYNDFEELNIPASLESNSQISQTSGQLGGLRVQIRSSQDRYLPRSSANLTIAVTNDKGRPVPAQLSISITDQELSQLNHPLFSTIQAGNQQKSWPQLDEDISLSGTLYEPDGSKLLPLGNVGAFLVNQQKFLYDKADENGHFVLDLPPAYGKFPIHIGGFLPEDLLAKLNQHSPQTDQNKLDLPYPSEVLQYLELSRKRKTIYQLYGQLGHNFSASFPKMEQPREEADSPISLDEYSAFSDIPTLVKELLIPIRFRKQKDETYNARIFDPTVPSRKFHTKGPVFVLDGRITRDADFIARLNIKKIERFDLYYIFKRGLRLFGPMARNGIVLIQSRNRDVEVPPADQKNFFEIQGFQAEVDYPIQIDTAENSKVLLRPALYWHPNLATDEDGEVSLSVPLSDDYSRFQIEVVVQGLDGQRGLGKYTFKVGGED